MDSKPEITEENLVVKNGSNSQQHFPIWRDEQGKEFVFSNSQAPFTPVPLEQIKGATRREKRS